MLHYYTLINSFAQQVDLPPNKLMINMTINNDHIPAIANSWDIQQAHSYE